VAPSVVNSTGIVWVTLLDVAVTVAVPAVALLIKETLTIPESPGVVTVYEAVPPGKVPSVVVKVTEVPTATA